MAYNETQVLAACPDLSAMPKSSPALLVAIVGLLVGACSQPTPVAYSGANQPRVVPDGRSVTIVNVHSAEDGQSWADSYCAQRGQAAHFNKLVIFRSYHRQPTDSASFDCVQI